MLEMFFADIDSMELIATYENPVEGIMGTVKKRPDVLLLDIEMPYLSGLEALETLDSPPKVVVISGHLENPNTNKIPIDKFISKSQVQSAEFLKESIMSVLK